MTDNANKELSKQVRSKTLLCTLVFLSSLNCSLLMQVCPHGCMERNYFIHNSSQEELPPPSQLSVEATTQRELYFDPYSNGKCPRSKCACVRKHWDDCCESIAHIVEECEERLRDFSIWLPPPVRPSRQRLVDAVASTYWSAKAEEMDCTADDLDLHLPLRECMAGFYSNLEAIFQIVTEMNKNEPSMVRWGPRS
jgi:hypothetical protein